jgi:hypothetical protein
MVILSRLRLADHACLLGNERKPPKRRTLESAVTADQGSAFRVSLEAS